MAIKAADQISIIDITDSYTIMLTSESYTFAGDQTYALAGSCETCVIAYQGNDSVPVTVGTCVCPTGVTAAVTNNGTASPKITFTVAAGKVTDPCEVAIPITVDDNVEFTKKFSIGVAKKGDNITITSTSVTYAVSSNGTTAPTSGWQASIPSSSAGQYTWTKTVVTYSDDASTTSYTVSRNGTNGNNGQDAITISITSSAGLIFKNASIATTLTAHVYKGGKELTSSTSPTLASQGTIKWYKDGGTTAVGTGQTLTITAGDVTNKASYTARLEG